MGIFDNFSDALKEGQAVANAAKAGSDLNAIATNPVEAISKPQETAGKLAGAMGQADNKYLHEGMQTSVGDAINQISNAAKSITADIPGAEAVISAMGGIASASMKSISELVQNNKQISDLIKNAGAMISQAVVAPVQSVDTNSPAMQTGVTIAQNSQQTGRG